MQEPERRPVPVAIARLGLVHAGGAAHEGERRRAGREVDAAPVGDVGVLHVVVVGVEAAEELRDAEGAEGADGARRDAVALEERVLVDEGPAEVVGEAQRRRRIEPPVEPEPDRRILHVEGAQVLVRGARVGEPGAGGPGSAAPPLAARLDPPHRPRVALARDLAREGHVAGAQHDVVVVLVAGRHADPPGPYALDGGARAAARSACAAQEEPAAPSATRRSASRPRAPSPARSQATPAQ